MTNATATWRPVRPQRNGLIPRTAIMTLIGVLAGTGGYTSAEHPLMHRGTGSATPSSHDGQTVAPEHGLAIELQLIRKTLRLSVAETAQLFGVSRPTIYSWQKGNPINSKSADRVRAIAKALEPHLHLLEAQVGRVALRSIDSQTTLLKKLSQDANPHETLEKLADILGQETIQRQRLADRLHGRSGNRGAIDLDALG